MKEFGLKLKIDGDISDILQSLKSLKSAFSNVEIPDGLAKNLNKSIDSAIQKIGEFGKKSETAINSMSDSKEIAKAWKAISKELTGLQVKLEGIDAKNLFPKEVIANIEKAEAAAKSYNEALNGAKSSDAYKAKLEELSKIAELQKATEANSKKASQDALKAEATYNKEKTQWTDEVNQKYEEQQKKITDTTQAFEEQQKKVRELIELQKQLQSEGYLTSNKTVPIKKKEAIEGLSGAEAEEKTLKGQASAAKGAVTKYKNANSQKDLSKDQKYLTLVQKQIEAEKKYEQALQRVKQLREQSAKVTQAQNIGKQVSDAKALENSLKSQAEAAKEAGSALSDQKKSLDEAQQSYINASADAETYKKNLKELDEQQDNINNELKNIQTNQAEKEWNELVSVIKEFTGIDLSESAHDIEAVNNAVAQYQNSQIENLPQILKEIINNTKPIAPAMEKIGDSIKEVGEDTERLTQASNEIQNLKNQVLDFFSITNSVQLFKRAITSALDTVKELDATMTEAAVVTEFDVGDMWEKLPEYSKNAQALGVSINGMYQATTLYYQQGLKSNEAMELGIETMKMAKIAGMDSTNATKAMTAALRGFNMELNEMSATKVNDVYSQLAAVTAADTNQIATAMEKTASIAASANMEFETTAALLAQIIETTQEAPETAGTAMKTIIARFAEVKSLREQGLTSGEDDEGEIIDVNKIQTALRSVGISMEGFFSGEEGLDSVLLKLAEKWGSLDFETQRYIATMAAGSRQQSRFIAMMSDYGRTTQLVGQAQNSAGASQKQFEKTQDSLETSLTRLKNAWDEFLMGLANNEVLKAGVDGLTKILETINKVTDALSGGNGLIKSIISLGGVLSVLKGGKTLLGGTAAGGALSGIVSKITGTTKGEDGSTVRKSGYFSLPEGVDPGEGWSKEEWKRGTEAKKAQRAANKKPFKEQLKNKFTNTTTTKTQTVSKNLGQMEMGLSEDDLSARAMGIRKLNEELAEGLITEEQAAEGYVKLGGSLEDLDTVTTKTSLNFDAIGQAANTAGMAMMAAGAATSLLASAFESWGMEEEAEAMQTLSGVLMTLGPILMGIGSFLPVLTGLTAAQAAATWAALWPILLIVAALAALVAVFVLVAKASHEASLEGRMQAAAEATERAKEAAEGAKQAYDDLLSAKSGYDELQNKLDTLTKGTLEWKQALAESNAQVLELLDKYPELAKYLTRGEHGELENTDEGWEYVTEQQAQAVKNANANVIASQMDETRLQQEKNEETLKETAKKEGIYKKQINTYTISTGEQAGTYSYETTLDTDQLDEKDLSDIYQKYKESGEKLFKLDADGSYSDELESFAESINQTAEEIYNMKDALSEYDKQLANNEATLQAQSEALLSAQASDEVMQYEYSKELIAGMSAGFAKTQDTREKEIAKKFEYDSSESVKDSKYFKTLAKEAGVDSTELTGDNTHDLEVLYAKMAGISTEEISDDLKNNQEELINEIAKMQAAKDIGKETEQVYQKMSALNENSQREYAILMSGDISNATMKDATAKKGSLEKMKEDLGFKTYTEMATYFGYEDTIIDGEVVKTAAENMAEGFKNIRSNIQKEFENFSKGDIAVPENILDKANVKQVEAYVNLMTQAIATGGKESLQKGFEEIFSSTEITGDQKQQILSAMETYDWTEEGAGEQFLVFLETIGVDIKKIIPDANNFVKELKGVDAVLRDFDASTIMNQIQEKVNEIQEISDNNALSNEQYLKFLEDGTLVPEEWFWNGKEWVSKTETGMKNLIEALKANTEALLGTTKEEAQTKIDWYKKRKSQIKQMFVGGRNIGAVSEPARQALYSGQATENLWKSAGFTSQKEYDEFVALENGDLAKLYAIINMVDAFQMPNFTPTKENWENPIDKQYNTYEKINTLINKRNKLERQYQKLLDKSATTGAELVANSKAQISNLNSQKKLQESLKTKKASEIQSLMNKNSKYDKYVTGFDEKTGEIKINWAEIDKIKDTDKGQKVEDYISKLEGLRDQWQDTQDSIDEIDDTVSEIRKQGEDEFFDLEDRLKSALVQERQDEIDKLTSINDSINETNSALLSAMQEQINEYRQNRDNAKTEEEIADKQRRLAYLQQDTSGANATEILKLQEEIDKAQEDYTDTLIDQKINELQKQNDAAAEQRERQIAVLKTQLESYEKSGQVWQDVYELWQNTINGKKLNYNSNLVTLLKDTEGFEGMSNLSQDKWLSELADTVAKAFGYTQLNRANKGDTVKFTTKDKKKLTGTADENGNITVGGKTYKNVHKNNEGDWVTDESSKKSDKTSTTTTTEKGSGNIKSLPSSTSLTVSQIKKLQKGLNELHDDGLLKLSEKLSVDGSYGPKTKEAVKVLQKKLKVTQDGIWGPNTKTAFDKSTLKSYATGGLADFTGPAWLDGTKSKPEYILSADQTEAFFTLVDVLGGLTGKSAQSTQNNGDTTYDIDINVEKVDSDYSVEQIAEKVKGMIVSSSRYRNNNTL